MEQIGKLKDQETEPENFHIFFWVNSDRYC